MTSPNTAGATADKTSWPLALGGALAVGLVVGFLTRVGQEHLPDALRSLANSAGPWTLVAFGVSLLARGRVVAVIAAVAAFVAMLAGYSVSAIEAGYAVSSSMWSFWGLCAVVVGPVVALLGQWAKRDAGWGRTLTVVALSGLLVAEGLYGLTVVGATTSPVFWSLEIAVGLAAVVVLWFRDARQRALLNHRDPAG